MRRRVFRHTWTAKELNVKRRSVVNFFTDMDSATGTIILDERIINRVKSKLKEKFNMVLAEEDLQNIKIPTDDIEEIEDIIGAEKHFNHKVKEYKKF